MNSFVYLGYLDSLEKSNPDLKIKKQSKVYEIVFNISLWFFMPKGNLSMYVLLL